MAQDFYKRSSTFKALSLGDGIGILTGIGNPWNEYINVPLGSRYYKQDGTEWKKVGLGDTESNWSLDYTVFNVPANNFTKQYFSSLLTVSTGSTTDIVVAILNSTGLTVGTTYLVRYEGILNTPKGAEYMTVGLYQNSNLLVSKVYDTNTDFQNIPMSLTVPILATSATDSFSIKIKTSNNGKIVSIAKPFILLEGL